MRINWSDRAIAELGAIADEIAKDSPQAAERVAQRVVDVVASLSSMAERGKPGRVPNTRELLVLPWSYSIVYRIAGDEVRILHVRHSARRWPVRG